MNRFIQLFLLTAFFFIQSTFAEIKEVSLQLNDSDVETETIRAFSFGSSFFLLDRSNQRLLQVDSQSAATTTVLTFDSLTSLVTAPMFLDSSGLLYILITENVQFASTLKFAVINLATSPSTYTTRTIPAELSKLESGESDQIQMFAGAAGSNGRIFIIDNSMNIHIVNSDNSYAGFTNVAELTKQVSAEQVNFAASPDGTKIAVVGFKDGSKQTRKVSFFDVGSNGLIPTGKTVKPKGTYPQAIVFSKDGKDIFVGAGKGAERFKVKRNLDISAVLKSRKSSSDGIYNLSQGNRKIYAVFLRSANKIFSLKKTPDQKGLGVNLVAVLDPAFAITQVASNSANDKALVTALDSNESNKGHVYLVDLK